MSTRRHRIIAAIVLPILVVVGSPSAFALDPRLDVSQYAHTAWRISDGFAKGRINAIAQTADGYLWLGTNNGLMRFDGVKATPWEPPSNHALPSEMITALLAARDGTLWIATDRGVVSWRKGRLSQFTRPDGPYRAGRLLEDRDGTVWGAVYLPRINRFVLCTFQRDRVECHGEDGGAGAGAVGPL
jgi:ligand-binding sensor domain-containing protein